MTTRIFVQTTEVIGESARHLGMWIVQDGLTTVIDAKASGLLGAALDPFVPFGEIVFEKNVITNVPDNGSNDNINEFDLFNLNELKFESQQEAVEAALQYSVQISDTGF